MNRITGFILLILLTINSSSEELNAQGPGYFFEASTTTCTTDSCDVMLRQHTGLYVGYTLSIRCLDSAGNWSGWSRWSGSGVYSGSICGRGART